METAPRLGRAALAAEPATATRSGGRRAHGESGRLLGGLPRETAFERGRYIASIVCSECHGADFRGHALEGGPPLAIVAAYDADQFRKLLRTGRSPDGREIPKMSWMPDVDFTEQEIADLYAFLRELNGLPAGG